jgi:hypothetical protein
MTSLGEVLSIRCIWSFAQLRSAQISAVEACSEWKKYNVNTSNDLMRLNAENLT